MAHGHFYWNELMTRDVESAKSFYGDVIGWTFEAMEMADGGTYFIAKDGDTSIGGMFDMKGPDFEGMPPHWFSYISVDDVDARVDKALSAGATLKRPLFDVPGVGRIALIVQPDGAAVGWMTPANNSHNSH
jgi:predicted enzyme related to lactoylglutathione lyase